MNHGKTQLRTGLILASVIAGLAVLSLFWTPYDINQMDTLSRMQPPSFRHLFGTDNMGRDVFSRAIVGGRFTLAVALSTVAGCTVISSVLGLLSGYAGGIIDEIIMRIVDAVSSFPGLLIALIIVTVMKQGNYTIVLALCITFVPSFTRIVRTGTLQYKNADFVKSNKVFGDSDVRLLLVHVLPNILPLLLSSIIIGLSNAILAESGMSYLGLGIQPPAPSWGRMLYESQSYIFNAPWCALAPGLMIVVTIVAFNCIGEGIRKRYLA
ncbi:MAG: ABC transporter permease [Firmicutes bacterium]|nr:ABC transporter permease [Bacillota bacterium]